MECGKISYNKLDDTGNGIYKEEDGCDMKRIGLLTSGGDCQALNATMRGVVKGLANNVDELEVYGFMNGYKGLIYGDYRMLSSKDFSGILTRGYKYLIGFVFTRVIWTSSSGNISCMIE